ncbi:MAG: class I SAM-dependent methyltransferase [Polyangia bacterium]|jgi:SAM-dependent methyltransferase|nr:class I SAM-dependent methyltransferase [Polyangia bacterium]
MTRIELTFRQELHRLAAYQFLEPWIRESHVLELGCGDGHGLRQLVALGARSVLGMDRAPHHARSRVEGLGDVVSLRGYQGNRLDLRGAQFDVVIVNDVAALLGTPRLLQEICATLSARGMVVVRAESRDRTDAASGATYGELMDLLEPAFPTVRVFGQSPFVGYSLAELTGREEEDLDVFVDGALMSGAVEEVGSYIFLCGAVKGQEGVYGILQVPAEGDSGLERWRDSLVIPGEESGDEGGDLTREPGDSPWRESQVAVTGREGDMLAGGPATEGAGDPAGEVGGQLGRGRSEGVAPSVSGLYMSKEEAVKPQQEAVRIALEELTDGRGGLIERWRWPGAMS